MVLDTYVSQPGKEYFRSAIGTVSIYIEEGTRDTQLIMMCVA